jgi:hypothetical protein
MMMMTGDYFQPRVGPAELGAEEEAAFGFDPPIDSGRRTVDEPANREVVTLDPCMDEDVEVEDIGWLGRGVREVERAGVFGAWGRREAGAGRCGVREIGVEELGPPTTEEGVARLTAVESFEMDGEEEADGPVIRAVRFGVVGVGASLLGVDLAFSADFGADEEVRRVGFGLGLAFFEEVELIGLAATCRGGRGGGAVEDVVAKRLAIRVEGGRMREVGLDEATLSPSSSRNKCEIEGEGDVDRK